MSIKFTLSMFILLKHLTGSTTKFLLLHLKVMTFTINFFDGCKVFLTGRSQQIKCGGCLSNKITVTSEVPQGLHGPTFDIFINDFLVVTCGSRFLMFGDDVKDFRTVFSIGDPDLLQNDLTSLSN